MKTLIANNVAEKLHRLASDASNPITHSLGVWVARVLLEEKRARVELDETPWDVSSRAVRTNKPFGLAKYETVEQFLEGEATGNTCATYSLFAILDGMPREIGREALAATLYFATLSLSNSLRPELAQRDGVPHVPA